MREPVFTGACVAIVTPFNSENKVDFEQFGKLIKTEYVQWKDIVAASGAKIE